MDLCEAFDLSRSDYHAWVATGVGIPRPGQCHAQAAHRTSLCRQPTDLWQPTHLPVAVRHGQPCSRHRVARLMRGHRMQSQS